MNSKIGRALSGTLPAKQAATLATTATSIADDKLANQFSKWWDIKSYASKCDVSGHSKEEQWAAKYQGIALKDKLFSGPDLLQSLIGIIFRFREDPIALSADIETMFLQVAVPNEDSRCLQFLWREDQEQKIEVYTRHVFGAKSLPTYAVYALQQVAKDNAVKDESLVRTVQRNFYMDEFLKSARTPQEAIESYQKIRDILIKGGFNLTKWTTSDEEVKTQITEADRSTKVVETFETEPQSSSILGLNWNVDTDSLIVCRGTEQEVPAKIT